MKIEEKDLQSAITKASVLLECSVIELEYEILQHPKKGFFGFGKKNAIIKASVKKRTKKTPKKDKFEKNDKYKEEKNSKKDQKTKSVNFTKQDALNSENSEKINALKNDSIFDNFHKESTPKITSELLDEISIKLKKLLASSCFDIDLVELSVYDENCILIKLDGADAALMIGKEAHRYKAISYILHNWINLKYKLLVRLEIAQFLESQTQAMQIYLQNIIEKIKLNGRGQTKPLDGVLIKIALEELRKNFPDKYVGIRQNNEQRFVVVDDFFKK